jgi:hypothetical protein
MCESTARGAFLIRSALAWRELIRILLPVPGTTTGGPFPEVGALFVDIKRWFAAEACQARRARCEDQIGVDTEIDTEYGEHEVEY